MFIHMLVKQGDEPGTHKKEKTQSGKPCMKTNNKHLFSKALEPVDVGYILITTTQVVVRMGLVLPSNLRLLYLCNAST
jgi:hypothetical protein